MAAFMLICAVFMARMMARMMGGMGGMCGLGRGRSGHHETDAANRILDERLARGEIDIGEYRRLRDAIAGTSSRAGGEGGDQH
ncbi:MAG: SHOCT domain-containing protein [Actinomycetota bacterium]